ncbi:MAG: hypothetical protein CEN92_223 [Candidatus Berkelbacteria bacterium Licking1014_96]|uniref:Uncharacterized protein n=1 Tax=Candidatus Berkelbacteria bacterium Licking1014_96 TaxID=2017149 RepID=A0A554LFQ0_9BACT|nr:MAG: hypothetical protein CEN92_223 [Candidatus Berkelbacteria bacterium Licking1014_96]
MRIRIISTPAGGAPPEIREQWVGVELPVDEADMISAGLQQAFGIEGIDAGTRQPTRGRIENRDGYAVDTQAAVGCLKQAGRIEAAEWWQRFLNETGGDILVFGRQFCEVVEE